MGQDLHITRSEQWEANEGAEITLEEWCACVEADPELVWDPANGPHAVTWTGHPEPGTESWLEWLGGNVYATNPGTALSRKMLEVASAFEARVVNDQNEVYERVEDLAV